MSNICKYRVYHETDKSNVAKILNEGFRYNKNDSHWLGNGFYFFFDKGLAERWAEQVVQGSIGGYGEINSPACVQCDIEIAKDNVLDLRFLDDYNFVKSYFQKFITEVGKRYDLNNADRHKVKCLFFNYMKRKNGIFCVIAYLSERNNLSKEIKEETRFRELKVPYIEIQMCLSRNEFIVDKREI